MEQENNGTKKKKFGEKFKDNLQKLIIIIVSVVYIVQGVFAISERDTTLLSILGSVGFSIVIGVIISSSLNTMGLKDGRKSEKFINSEKSYGETKSKATPYFDKLSDWCEFKNHQELEFEKKDIIQSAGLKWKAYKIGFYHNKFNQLEEDKQKVITEADHLKIQKLTARELLSDLPTSKLTKFVQRHQNRFGESEKNYKQRNAIFDFTSRILIGVICGAYTLMPVISKDNAWQVVSGMIWNTMQISLWLTFGLMKYENAKSFMIDEYRQTHIIQKTEYLNEFIVTMEKDPKVIENYDDEDKEIEQYINDYLKKGQDDNGNDQREKDISS